MKFAWIENDRIRDIAQGNPTEIYHPDVAQHYNTQVPDDAANGDGWVNGQLVKPEPFVPPTPEPAPRTWTASDVRAGLTLAERVKWDNDAAPEVITAKQELASPQLLEHTKEVLALLVGAGVIAQTSVTKIIG